MNELYLVDTNAILSTPEILSGGEEYLLISDILRELEDMELQRRSKELSYQIRKAKRSIIENKESIQYLLDHQVHNYTTSYMPDGYSKDYPDNVLLATAIGLSNSGDYNQDIVVVTNDILLQLKCQKYHIKTIRTTDYQNGYSGVFRYEYDSSSLEEDEVLWDIYKRAVSSTNPLELKEGQYIELFDKATGRVTESYLWRSGEYVRPTYRNVVNPLEKVKPINNRQRLAFDLMQDDSRPIKLIKGPQGSGKDKIMFSHALRKVHEEGKKIIWIRSNVGVKDAGELGFLPGTLEEKMYGFYALLVDYLGDRHMMEKYIEDNMIIIENLEHIRGRQFDNAILYLTEAQNLTDDHIKLVLGRAGDNTEVYINGDDEQSDIGYASGLYVLDKLAGNELFGKVELHEVERSSIARLAEDLL